jgi:tetratricopeptide (TPR) repeat protein
VVVGIRRHPLRFCAVVFLLLFIGVVGIIAGQSIWAEYHSRAARRCLVDNKPFEAQRHLEEVFRFRNDASTHLLAARVARRLHDGRTAQAHLDECERILGGIHPETDLERELIQAQMGDFIQVERSLQHRLDHDDPESAAILEVMAEGYWNYNHLPSALRCLNQWLDLQPGNVRAYYLRGEVQEASRHYKEAAQDFEVCLDSEPGNVDFRFKLGNALLERGVPDQALPHFQALREQLPENITILWYVARCEIGMGHPDKAKELLATVTAKRPAFAEGWRDLGKLALDDADHDRAERCLRKAIELTPGDKQSHFSLYNCLLAEGKETEASEELAALQRVEADLHRIYLIREMLLPNQPRNFRLHYELGTLYLRLEMKDEGVRWLESCLRLAPEFSEAKEALAKYHQAAGNQEDGKPDRVLP